MNSSPADMNHRSIFQTSGGKTGILEGDSSSADINHRSRFKTSGGKNT